MRTPEKAESRGHGRPVERLPDVPGERPKQRRGHRAVFDEIAVALGPGPPSSVEAKRSLLDGQDTDLLGEQSIETSPNRQRVQDAGRRQAGDLARGVNTRVGTACADDFDRLAENPPERLGKGPLDGGPAGLNLPAMEGRAVVLDEKLQGTNMSCSG